MEFVIELDSFTCSVTESEVVGRRRERREGGQHRLAVRTQFGNVEVELCSYRIGASKRARKIKIKGRQGAKGQRQDVAKSGQTY